MWNNILIYLGLRKMSTKFWIVYSPSSKNYNSLDNYVYDPFRYSYKPCGYSEYYSDKFNTLAAAEAHAKEKTVYKLGRKYTILEAMTETVPPIPDVQLSTLTSSATPA